MNRSEFKRECLKGIEDITDAKIGEALERFNHTILEEYKNEMITEKEAKWLTEEIGKRYNGQDEIEFYAEMKEKYKRSLIKVDRENSLRPWWIETTDKEKVNLRRED